MILSSIKLDAKQLVSASNGKLNIGSGLKLYKLSSGKLEIKNSKFAMRGVLVPQTDLQTSKISAILPISTEMQRVYSSLRIEIGQESEVYISEYAELYLHNPFISKNIDDLFEIYKKISYEISEFDFDLFLKELDDKKIDSFESLYNMY